MLDKTRVTIIYEPDSIYPSEPPFHPGEIYPEYPFREHGGCINWAYLMVRDFFRLHGLDHENYGTSRWNPLGDLIDLGDTVLIKPNLVTHRYGFGHNPNSVFTHGSVIRAILDYVYIALRHTGEIIIGDAPLQSCDFPLLCQINGLDRIREFYGTYGGSFDLVDFRLERAITSKRGWVVSKAEEAGDPRGYTVVDWGNESLLMPIADDFDRYRVSDYEPDAMSKHHNCMTNEYLIANSVVHSDVVINLPKMKTHSKAGLTAALKNVVGINGHKDWLPHHRAGSEQEGGDEYRNKSFAKSLSVSLIEKSNMAENSMERSIFRVIGGIAERTSRLTAKDCYYEGGWYGNDTIWRTVLDLNRAMYYLDKSGRIRDGVQRRFLTLVDGIVAGEKEGPLKPTPKNCGLLIGGENPAAVDAVIARLMGFDYRRIPLVRESFGNFSHRLAKFRPDEISINSNSGRWQNLNFTDSSDHLAFEPAEGWKGHIEL